MSQQLTRRQYVELYGPTTGDAVRLGDTDLFAVVERDHAVYGDEVVFGGGKVIRDGMGQNSRVTRSEDIPDARPSPEPALPPTAEVLRWAVAGWAAVGGVSGQSVVRLVLGTGSGR